MKLNIISFWCLIVLAFSSCEDQEQKNLSPFNLEGHSQITIINRTNEAFPVSIENWQVIPLEAQEFDTILSPSVSLTFKIRALGRSYYNMTIGEQKHKIFAEPGAKDSLIVVDASEPENLNFTGDSRQINKFLLKKTKKFGSPDADWHPRAAVTYDPGDFSNVISLNDSVTQEHISFLEQNAGLLPEWYVDFETERLKYLDLGFKINSFSYRRELLGRQEALPVNFLDEIHSTVEVENPKMLGNMRYYYFLKDYISYKKDSTFARPQPKTKKDREEIYRKLFATIDAELKGPTRDFILTSIISRMIIEKKEILDTSWISKIEDIRSRNFLQKQLTEKAILEKGSPIPHFSLQDVDGKLYEPKDFKNKIVLINFWATWCRPCVEEFPEENILVEKFKKEPVVIVNIGIDSDFNQWNKMVQKHELKTLNLIAQDDDSKILRNKFDVRGLPHSVLIDWNGKVVQNRSLKASTGADEQIAELLRKRKTEN